MFFFKKKATRRHQNMIIYQACNELNPNNTNKYTLN